MSYECVNIADGGTGVPEDPNAQRRKELQELIDYLTTKKEELEGYKDDLTALEKTLNENVFDPVNSYKLSVDNNWAGNNYDKAVKMKDTMNSNLKFYRMDVLDVIRQIGLAISDLEAKIGELNSELASLG